MADTDYFAQTTYSASASQTAFSVGFAALNSSHIKLAIDGVDSTAFNITGDLTGGSGTLNYTGTALSGGERVRVYRRSPETFATLGFQSSGADPLTAADLDTLVKGLLYLTQEAKDRRRPQWVDISAAHTVDPDSAQAFACDTSSAGFTMTLPLAASWRGEELIFKHEVTGNTLTIDGNGAETIDGAVTVTVTDIMLLSSDGDEWHILEDN